MSEGVGDGDLEASSVTRGEPVCVPLHLVGVVGVDGSYGVNDMLTGMAKVSSLSPVYFHAARRARAAQPITGSLSRKRQGKTHPLTSQLAPQDQILVPSQVGQGRKCGTHAGRS